MMLLYRGCKNSTHCLTVTSLFILLLTPVLLCPQIHFGPFGFNYLKVFVDDLLPSGTVGRFCSVWNMVL